LQEVRFFTKPLFVTNNLKQGLVTQIRLQLQITWYYPLNTILSNIIFERELTVDITGTKIEKETHKYVDVEIQGTIVSISNGLSYL
jgi:hypothetical protein